MTVFKKGDTVRLISDDPKFSFGSVNKGDTGTVVEVTTNSFGAELFVDFPNQKHWSAMSKELELVNKGENMTAKKQYQLGDVIDLSEQLVQLSNEAHKEFQKGDKFVVVNKRDAGRSELPNGTVIELAANDGSSNPYFYFNSSNKIADSYNAVSWAGLAKLPEGKTTKQKPVVASTRTVYSDGVEVSEDEVKFDGQTHKREDLKKLVARYNEVLRRPVASVVTAKKPAARKAVAKKGKK